MPEREVILPEEQGVSEYCMCVFAGGRFTVNHVLTKKYKKSQLLFTFFSLFKHLGYPLGALDSVSSIACVS